MANARFRTASLGVLNAITPWLSARRGANLTVSGVFVGTVTVMRRDPTGLISPLTTQAGAAIAFTGPVSYQIGQIGVQGDYALKMTAYTSGAAVATVEGW